MKGIVPYIRRHSRQIAIGVVVIGIAIQLLRFIIPPFKIQNPDARQDIQWDTAETQRIWTESCADCHSNETVWPFYSYIAPMGWLVAADVHEGRDHLNVDEDRRVELNEMIEVIQEGEMPPWQYLILHPDADLTDSEKTALVSGLRSTFAGSR